MVIKRVSPMSVAKVSFVLYAVIGLIMAGVFTLFGAAFGSLAALGGGRTHSMMGFPEMFLGIGAVIVLPIVYGVMAAIFSALGALVYNAIAGWIGGIEIEVQ